MLVRNGRAIELTQYPARIWLICSWDLEKNILAKAQTIVVEGFILAPRAS
jgi:hypothetical protein